jgi:hypothetical protein
MSTLTNNAKFRGLSGAADQILSSLSNGMILYAVAVVSTAQYFGLVAVQLTMLAAGLGALRGALGTKLLLKAGEGTSSIRREGAYAVTAALLLSPVLAAAMFLVRAPGLLQPTIVLAVATPIVLVQDVLRYVAITEGRPHVAAIWDGVWLIGSLGLLVCTWLNWEFVTVSFLIAGWGVLGLAALVGLALSTRLLPRVSGFVGWLRTDWQNRLRYGVDTALEQLGILLMLVLVALLVSPVVVAALRGATALLTPVSILIGSLPLIVIPETVRRSASPQEVWRKLQIVYVPGICAVLLVSLVVRVLPDNIGTLILGNSFGITQQIIVWMGLQYIAAWFALAMMLWLKTFNRSADLLKLKTVFVLLMIGFAVATALIFKTATGVAVGLVLASTVISAFSMAWFAPWRASNPSHDPKSTTEGISTGDSRSAALPPAWHHKVIRRSRSKPKPLPDFVRLDAHRGSASGVTSVLLSMWVFAIMGVLGPILVIGLTGPAPNLSWLGPLAVTVLAAARFAWIIGSGERRLFEIMFWAFTYPFMGLAPITEIRQQKWPIIVPRSDFTLVWPAVAIVLCGTSAFLLGVLTNRFVESRSRRRGAAVTTAPTSAVDKQPADRNQLIDFSVRNKRVVILAAFAIALNLYYSYKVGFIQFAQRREDLKAKITIVWPATALAIFVVAGTYMTLVTAWVSLMRFRREAKVAARWGRPESSGTMRLNLVLLWILGIMMANTMNPISNARYLSGTAMLAVAAGFGLFATAWRFRLSILGFTAALIMVFPVMDYFRYTTTQNLDKANPLNAFVSPDYDSFSNVVNGYLIAQREGIEVGRQFLGVMLFWVPRALWTDKPVDTGMYLAQSRGYPVVNLSAPLWIELYFNGGFIFLVIAMFALGYVLHAWDTRVDRQLAVFKMPSVLGSILPFYMFILLRGSLLQAMPYLVVTVVCWLFVRQRNKAGPRRLAAAPRAPAKPGVVKAPERVRSPEREVADV